MMVVSGKVMLEIQSLWRYSAERGIQSALEDDEKEEEINFDGGARCSSTYAVAPRSLSHCVSSGADKRSSPAVIVKRWQIQAAIK